MIFINIVLLVLGIAVVLWGADTFVDGAKSVARRWNMSELVIGLTVVAMGTSLPEFCVSCISALQGSSDMSVGNVIGSNVFNTLVVIGAPAMFLPIKVSKRILWLDMLITIGIAFILVFMLLENNGLRRLDGAILLLLFSAYISWTIYDATHSSQVGSGFGVSSAEGILPWGRTLFCLLIGVACLVGGGELMVKNACALAREFGMSERVIGITILATGTSLPELATSLMAARKGSTGLAIGNALGSNVFNVLMVLGASSAISPIFVKGVNYTDFFAFVGSGVVLWLLSAARRKIGKPEGAILLILYLLYMVMLCF